MSKKVKRKVIISVISLVIIFILAMMISGYFDLVNIWMPVLEDEYLITSEIYDFFLIASFIIVAFIILLNICIWLYDKIFKD